MDVYQAIVIVLLILIVAQLYCQSVATKVNEGFSSSAEKYDRARVVAEKTSSAFAANPKLSYKEFKNIMPDGNAVEYNDVKSTALTGRPIIAQTLASSW